MRYRITRIEHACIACATGHCENPAHVPLVWTGAWFEYESPQQGPDRHVWALNEKNLRMGRCTEFRVERSKETAS